MDFGRLNRGEKIAAASAGLLLASMFFHWFGVKATNTSHLLFAIQSVESGKSAWDALECTPTILLIAVLVTFTVTALRLVNVITGCHVGAHVVVVIFGVASVALIFYRIVDPPVFYVEPTITYEGTVQLPICLALLAAGGITAGSGVAIWERAFRLSNK
ncbi:MAG TPA: hypothetical protein VF245_01330 [Solirubrobacterales bacterium]